ncbi:MAG: hypothetical protein OXE52_05600 [Chloroflexi bacterium]|nr:hypothetical protein [Chloroflexota bacterium]
MVITRKKKQQVVEFDVHRYQQGGRTAYSLVMDLGTLDDNVPNFVSRDRIEKANRRFIDEHARRIAEYIYDVDDWILGAILLGITPDVVEFVPYSEEDGSPSDASGYIQIPLSGGTSTISILDGQHRRMAIRRVRERLRQEIVVAKELSAKNGSNHALNKLERKLRRLDEMSIPVALYEEANTKELRQMFADLAKTRNIDATTKTRFDNRDPFNRAAVELVEKGLSTLLTDRVEMERTSPVRASNDLLSVSQLARCMKVLLYGFGSRASRDRIREAENNYQELIDTGITWADEFLPRARKEYEELCSIELESDYLPKNRSKYASFSVPVLEVMAGCFHEWQIRTRPIQELTNWIREADFDVQSEECILLKSGMLIPGDPTVVSRNQNKRATINYIINQALVASS